LSVSADRTGASQTARARLYRATRNHSSFRVSIITSSNSAQFKSCHETCASVPRLDSSLRATAQRRLMHDRIPQLSNRVQRERGNQPHAAHDLVVNEFRSGERFQRLIAGRCDLCSTNAVEIARQDRVAPPRFSFFKSSRLESSGQGGRVPHPQRR